MALEQAVLKPPAVRLLLRQLLHVNACKETCGGRAAAPCMVVAAAAAPVPTPQRQRVASDEVMMRELIYNQNKMHWVRSALAREPMGVRTRAHRCANKEVAVGAHACSVQSPTSSSAAT